MWKWDKNNFEKKTWIKNYVSCIYVNLLSFLCLPLTNTDCLQKVEDYVRSCTWQLKKVKTIYRWLYLLYSNFINFCVQELEAHLDLFCSIVYLCTVYIRSNPNFLKKKIFISFSHRILCYILIQCWGFSYIC